MSYSYSENVLVQGAAGDLLHESAETLGSYLEKNNRYTSLQAQALWNAGRRTGLAKLVLSPVARFVKFYVLRLGFLDGAAGFAHIFGVPQMIALKAKG